MQIPVFTLESLAVVDNTPGGRIDPIRQDAISNYGQWANLQLYPFDRDPITTTLVATVLLDHTEGYMPILSTGQITLAPKSVSVLLLEEHREITAINFQRVVAALYGGLPYLQLVPTEIKTHWIKVSDHHFTNIFMTLPNSVLRTI